MATPEVRLACARPAELGAAVELADWLDEAEHDALRRLRFEEDRRAFLASHVLLRALVARECGCAPHEVALRHDARGKPFVANAPRLHVSLSRSRAAVACAVTLAAPVGVDVEPIAEHAVDDGLLGAFVAAPLPLDARQFHHHWTALEAFWKACGTGLADGQPRIRCEPRGASRFDVMLERASGACAGRGAVVHAFDDCALTVVLRAPVDPAFVLKRTHCRSALDAKQLGRAMDTHGSFFAT